MQAPSTNPITLRFGATTTPYSAASPHIGTDFSYNPDHQAYAAEDGQATVVVWDGKTREGNAVYLTFGEYRLAYCHLASFSIVTGPVKRGQVLGVMGETGFAQGKHLHVACRKAGVLVDITNYIEEDSMLDAKIKDREENRQLFLAWVARNPLPQEVDRYIGWTVRDAFTDIAKNASREVIDQFVTKGVTKEVPGGTAPDPDGQKWRDWKALNKELNS